MCRYFCMNALVEKVTWNYTRMQRAVLNKPQKLYSTKQQLFDNLPPISQALHDEEDMLGIAVEVRMNPYIELSNGLPLMDTPVLVEQQALSYISIVQTLETVERTSQERWKIRMEWLEREREREREGERERDSGSFVISKRLDDIDIHIYIIGQSYRETWRVNPFGLKIGFKGIWVCSGHLECFRIK